MNIAIIEAIKNLYDMPMLEVIGLYNEMMNANNNKALVIHPMSELEEVLGDKPFYFFSENIKSGVFNLEEEFFYCGLSDFTCPLSFNLEQLEDKRFYSGRDSLEGDFWGCIPYKELARYCVEHNKFQVSNNGFIGFVYRFGKNDYELMLGKFNEEDQKTLEAIFNKYCENDNFSSARGEKELSLDDANVDWWETGNEWDN